jgi:hypothetical protein
MLTSDDGKETNVDMLTSRLDKNFIVKRDCSISNGLGCALTAWKIIIIIIIVVTTI